MRTYLPRLRFYHTRGAAVPRDITVSKEDMYRIYHVYEEYKRRYTCVINNHRFCNFCC